MSKNKETRCPFFKRRINQYNYSGLMCSSQKYPNWTLGKLEKWSEYRRDKKLEDCCYGDYKNCTMYKNHTS